MELDNIFSFTQKTQLLFRYYKEYFFYKLNIKKRKKLISKINKIWKILLNKKDIIKLNKEHCILKIRLNEDAIFAYKNDPSFSSLEETILTSNGLFAIMIYRISNCLVKLGVDIVPRLLSEIAHNYTGIDIHPEATIGNRFFIDHGTGVVIGQTTYLGNEVKIYHGVTLGAKSIKNSDESKNKKRHPTILDGVVIYANATILGGDTVIGKNSIIGTGKIVLESISENSKVI